MHNFTKVKSNEEVGQPYGFVDAYYNGKIENAFPASWAWAPANTTFKQDDQSNLEWIVSSGRRSSANDKFYLGQDSGADGMDLVSLSTNSSDYAGMVSATGQTTGNGYAITSSDYIEAISDLHFSFEAEAGYIYVLYHLPTDVEGVWNVINNSSGDKSFNCTKTTSIDADSKWNGCFGSFNWTFKNVLDKNIVNEKGYGAERAKIAFVYWNYNKALQLEIKHISINTERAAIGYMNGLTWGWCENAEDPKLNKTTLSYFAKTLSSNQNQVLNDTSISGDVASLTHYTNYYSFFEFICEMHNIDISNQLNTDVLLIVTNDKYNYEALILICVFIAISIVSGGVILTIKKRKMIK